MEFDKKKNNTRIIGSYSSGKKGPLLFITGGIHGNEPSGIEALESVFKELNSSKPTIEGTILGVAGNSEALTKNVRFIDEDLNRTWKEENLKLQLPASHEQKEMREIIDILEEYSTKDVTKRYFLDCHTTSSATLPYISVQDVNDNNEWAHKFPTYIVKGFSDIVYGAIDHYLSRTGITGFVFEAGQHTSKSSKENHEGLLWLALKEACKLDLKEISCYPECVTNFTDKNAPEQKTFEIIHRHGLEDDDQFEMKPGFDNFQKIKKGEVLATQNGNEVKSEWNAHIFMPLYQSQGNDGFFVVDEI